MALGGQRAPLSSEARARIAAALRGKHHPHRGHPISEETRAKIAAALRARYGTHVPRHGRGAHRAASSTRGAHQPRAGQGHGTGHGPGGRHVAPPSAGHGAAKAAAKKRHHRPKHVLGAKLGHAHRPHKSAFSKVSAGAGYHHNYTGRLRVKRHSLQRGRLRVKRLYHTHHVRPRRH